MAMAAAAVKRVIRPLTPEYTAGAINCIAESFGGPQSEDPFSWCMNLKRHHWRTMGGMFVERAATCPRQLSVVSVNEETGEVDGVMVNEDWKEYQPRAYKSLNSDSWRPVRAIFNELHTRFKAMHPYYINEGEMLHSLYFTCVLPSARRQSVMKNLWDATVDNARADNYRYLVAEASREDVQRLLMDRLGFQEVSRVTYCDFMFEGQHIFEEIAEKAVNDGTSKRVEDAGLTIMKRALPSNLYV